MTTDTVPLTMKYRNRSNATKRVISIMARQHSTSRKCFSHVSYCQSSRSFCPRAVHTHEMPKHKMRIENLFVFFDNFIFRRQRRRRRRRRKIEIFVWKCWADICTGFSFRRRHCSHPCHCRVSTVSLARVLVCMCCVFVCVPLSSSSIVSYVRRLIRFTECGARVWEDFMFRSHAMRPTNERSSAATAAHLFRSSPFNFISFFSSSGCQLQKWLKQMNVVCRRPENSVIPRLLLLISLFAMKRWEKMRRTHLYRCNEKEKSKKRVDCQAISHPF